MHRRCPTNFGGVWGILEAVRENGTTIEPTVTSTQGLG